MPPGSRVRTTVRPSLGEPSSSRAACVVLPEPSPPSSVMKSPRALSVVAGVVAARRPSPRSPCVRSRLLGGGRLRCGRLGGGRLRGRGLRCRGLGGGRLLRGRLLRRRLLGGAFFAGGFAGPLARLSASSCTARSKSTSSTVSPRGIVALVSPSVTYGPKRPSLTRIGLPLTGSASNSSSALRGTACAVLRLRVELEGARRGRCRRSASSLGQRPGVGALLQVRAEPAVLRLDLFARLGVEPTTRGRSSSGARCRGRSCRGPWT